MDRVNRVNTEQAIRMAYKLWDAASTTAVFVWKGRESGACLVHGACCLSLQSTLESWRSRFWHQQRIASVAGQVNLPARVRTSKQRTKRPSSYLFMWVASRRCSPDLRGECLPTSNDLIKKSFTSVPICLGFSWFQMYSSTVISYRGMIRAGCLGNPPLWKGNRTS